MATDDTRKWFPNGATVQVPHWATDEQIKTLLDNYLGPDYDQPVTVTRTPHMEEGISIWCPPCPDCQPDGLGPYKPSREFHAIPSATLDLTAGAKMRWNIPDDNKYTKLFTEEALHMLPDNARANLDLEETR